MSDLEASLDVPQKQNPKEAIQASRKKPSGELCHWVWAQSSFVSTFAYRELTGSEQLPHRNQDFVLLKTLNVLVTCLSSESSPLFVLEAIYLPTDSIAVGE